MTSSSIRYELLDAAELETWCELCCLPKGTREEMSAALVAQDESEAAELAGWEAEDASRNSALDDTATAHGALSRAPRFSWADDCEEEAMARADAEILVETSWEEVTRNRTPKQSVVVSEPGVRDSQAGERLQKDTSSAKFTFHATPESEEDNKSTRNGNENQTINMGAGSTNRDLFTNGRGEEDSTTVTQRSSFAVTDREFKSVSEKSEDKHKLSRCDRIPEWDDHIASMSVFWELPPLVPGPLLHAKPSARFTQSAVSAAKGLACELVSSSNSSAAAATNSFTSSSKSMSETGSKKYAQQGSVETSNLLQPHVHPISETPKSTNELASKDYLLPSKKNKKLNKGNACNGIHKQASFELSSKLATEPEVDFASATDISTAELPTVAPFIAKEIPLKKNHPDSVISSPGEETAEESTRNASIFAKTEKKKKKKKKKQDIMASLADTSLAAEELSHERVICDQTTVVAEGEGVKELAFETPNSVQMKKKKRGKKGGKKVSKVDKSVAVTNSTDIKIGGVLFPWYAFLAAFVAQVLLVVIGIWMAT
ncbi:hypothetical protein N0V94_005693 [Neodidymelliopsis sp. IMI 364377]|nr:hypothetical protein N0V94_005693 [Neodidymelliopsis sp. IMI 364377]